MGKRRLPGVVLVIIVVSLLILLTLPSAFAGDTAQTRPGAAGGSEPLSEHFGVAASHLMLNDPQSIEKQFDAMAEAGIKWVRSAFTWTDLERKQGVWDFSKADFLVEKAAEHGVKILGILGACPPWANGGNNFFYPPTDMVAWRGYVSRVCARYRGRIAAWEVWNEENIGFWQPTPNPQDYVRVLGNASDEIRKADPGAQVVMGGVAGLGQTYLNDCLAAGAASYIDALAYHPYCSDLWGYWNPFDVRPNEARCRQVLQEMRAMISRYTSKPLKIWLTELGWNTSGLWGTVDQQTQAAYTLRTMINYASQGVDKVFYYSLWDEYPWSWWPDQCGLLKNDFTRKDAFYFYKAFEQFFGSAASTAPDTILSTSCSSPETLEVHTFRLPDGSLVVAAWKTSDLDDALSLTVKGSALGFPLKVNPSTGETAPVAGASRDSNGDIRVSNLVVGKVPTILKFDTSGRTGVWTGGHDVVGATSSSTTFYFAEGTCRPDFDSYFCIQNPGNAAANVTLTYMKDNGTTAADQVTVPPNSRSTVSPRTKLGTGDDAAHDFSTKVTCTNNQQIIVERPMYFNYHGVWTGGHDVVGATSSSTTFYFAEGTCRPDFDSYFCIQNPGNAAANVTLTYMKDNGTTAADQVTVPPNSRSTVSPRTKLGTGDDAAHDFSTKVTCTNNQQIIVERPMYFNYHGVWTGGHDVVGATSSSTTFYFAEGTCRPDFDSYFCIQNPGNAAANVTLTYMKDNGTTAADQVTVPPNSRSTVSPRTKLGTGDDAAHDFSTKVTCTNNQQIIVERPMYFNYHGVWTGGHDVVGATSSSTTFYFAEGTCRPDFDSYFCIQNPGNAAANVTLTYMKDNGTTAADQVTVPPNSRSTVSPRTKLGTGDDAAHDFSTKVTCTNNQQIIVERPMYFNYK